MWGEGRKLLPDHRCPRSDVSPYTPRVVWLSQWWHIPYWDHLRHAQSILGISVLFAMDPVEYGSHKNLVYNIPHLIKLAVCEHLHFVINEHTAGTGTTARVQNSVPASASLSEV